jgi:predicted RecA/RadA family phage recombinase
MLNYVQKGDVVTVTAPAAVSPGDFVVVGALFGVATTDAAQDAEVEIALKGVFELPLTGASQGDVVYYYDGDLTLDATHGDSPAVANERVGVAVADSANGLTRVRLDG